MNSFKGPIRIVESNLGLYEILRKKPRNSEAFHVKALAI